MTQQQLDATGFIVLFDERSIEAIIYKDYLCAYGSDQTTSPRGIAPRMHIREREVVTNKYEVDNDNVEPVIETSYEIWSWGVNGNNPRYTGISFDNEEAADLEIYEHFEYYIQEKNWDAPIFCATYQDAITEMANGLERDEAVITRYLALSKITARKDAEHRAKVTAEYNAHKAWLAIEVSKEADSITIDWQFKMDLHVASQMTGKDKSKFIERSFTLLLSRNGVEIKTDFWQVLRILKARAQS